MKQLRQWVCWKGEWDPKKQKVKKPPYNPCNIKRRAKAGIPSTWGSFDDALQQKDVTGIGFEFLPDSGIMGIDIDHCTDFLGEILPVAAEIIAAINSYTEYSPSGNGVHIYLYGKLPGGGKKVPLGDGVELELYDAGRYFTVTGAHVQDTPTTIENRQAELDAVYQKYVLSHDERKVADLANGHSEEESEAAAIRDDELIRKAHTAANGVKFGKLWAGDTSDYGEDASRADEALCFELAFWTGKDAARIDALFRQSGLMRDKWDEVHSADGSTYGAVTVRKAVKGTSGIYNPEYKRTDAAGEFWRELFFEAKGGDRLSDAGNSIRFAAMHRDKLRYCPAFKTWLVWDGRRWKQDETLEVRKAADETVRAFAQVAVTMEDTDKRTVWLKEAAKNEALAKRKAMIEGAQHLLPITADILDVNPWLLNCDNGTIDLQTGELLKHSPENYLTKLAPVEYNPAAECPRFDQFLQEIFPKADGSGADDELIRFVQKVAGYALTGVTNEQILCIAHGGGGNGKGTLLDLWAEIMGDYATPTPMGTLLASRNSGDINSLSALAALRGARLVVASESQEGQKLNEPLVKALTGEDEIAARFLHGNLFRYKPQFLLMMLTNHKPRVKADDEAMWRRIRVLPFVSKFEGVNKDGNLRDKLRKEKAGILRWMVEGCLLWQKEGLQQPEAVKIATGEHRAENDSFAEWLEERCIVDADCKEFTTKAREDYQRFINMRGSINPKVFTKLLRANGFRVYTAAGVSKVRGFRLMNNIDIDFATDYDEPDFLS